MKPVGHPRYGFRRKRGKEPYLPSIGVEGGVEISLKVELEGYWVRLLVDTGAQISVLKNPIPGIALEPSRLKARGVTGQSLTVLGEQELLCNLKGTKVRHRFTVAPIDTDHEGLIGLDLLKKLSAIVNVASGTVEISTRATERACFKVKNLIERERQTMVAQIDLLAKKYAPSWLKQPERSPKRRGKTRPRSNPGPREEVTIPGSTGDAEVKAAVRTRVPAHSELLLKAKVPSNGEPLGVLIEPVEQPQKGLRVGRCIGEVKNGEVWVKVINLTKGEVLIEKGQDLGLLEPWEAMDEYSRLPDDQLAEAPKDAWVPDLSHLESPGKELFSRLLTEYRDVFSPPDLIGCTLNVEHTIQTGEARPVAKRPYPVPFHQRPVVRQHLDEMLRNGIIEPSSSPWSAPVVLVKKKSTGGETKYRFCTDFRGLNSVTRVEVYPLPLIQETLEQLGRSRYFSTLDLASGYHQIKIAPQDQEKTAFTTAEGHFEYKRMAFGLAGAPATFQRLMDRLLMGIKGTECYVYLDDVIVYSPTIEEHVVRLGHILQKFREANLKVNGAKCYFARREVRYLGHIVGEDGVKTDPEKVRAVKEYPRPGSAKEIRAFLGLAGYYRRFVADFAQIAEPMTMLTKKDARFEWSNRAEVAFQRLKTELSSGNLLIYPDFRDPFIVATDASSIALGAVLSQKRNGKERPICYASRQLKNAEKNYSATELELLAVIWATKQFRCYLLGRKFRLVTDHAALKWMLSLRDPSSRLTRWALRLQEFDYEVEHKAGKKHSNADALSRVLRPLTLKRTTLTEGQIRESQRKDRWCLHLSKSADTSARDARGVLYWTKGVSDSAQWKLAVPEELRKAVIGQCHERPWAGHPGKERTLSIVKTLYYWPTIEKDVGSFVAGCSSCQQRKTPAGLKVPLEPPYFPTRPFEQISMDIVGPLPRSGRGNKYLLTMIDNFTRYAEGITLKEPTAKETARALVELIVTRHGVPERLLTDQGRNFVSELLKETCRELGIRKLQTTPYHPEGNGMVERLHRTIADSMAHYVRRDGRDWDRWVPYSLMAYRTIPHASTGYSPNFLLYGREIRAPLEYEARPKDELGGESDYPRSLSERLAEAYKEAAHRTELAWARRTKQCNKRRRTRNLAEGQRVYLHVPAVKPGNCKKFHCPWTGPHLVLRKLSQVNYLVKLADGREIVVHINRLKSAEGESEGDKENQGAEEVAPGEDINEVEDNFTSSDDSGDEPPMWYRAGESSDEEIDVEYEPPLSQKEPNLEEQEAFEEDRGGTSPAQRESEESHSLVQDFTEDPKDLTWVPEEQEPPNIRSPYQLRRRVTK